MTDPERVLKDRQEATIREATSFWFWFLVIATVAILFWLSFWFGIAASVGLACVFGFAAGLARRGFRGS